MYLITPPHLPAFISLETTVKVGQNLSIGVAKTPAAVAANTALVKRDKELCLYSLASQKNKEDVHYPKPFGGTAAEDVFEFLVNIEGSF